jgi:polysaccharide export outer membrane protein
VAPPTALPTDTTTNAAYSIVLSPGDSLEVSLIGVGALTAMHPQVDADGNVTLPYVGPIHIAGLTLPAAQGLIAQKYREGDYIVNPQVNVQVLVAPSQVIAVTGEVKSPSVIPALGQRRLLDIIAAAGGLTPQASHLVTVIRKSSNEAFQVLIDPNPMDIGKVNVPIYAGDTIIVARAGEIFVIGSVKTPNAIPLVTNSPLTVMQAVSIAGGANFEAALSQVRIIRTEGSERKAISLDLKRVLDGKEADPILQADDIVYVPANAFKGALKANGLNVATSTLLAFSYLLKGN